MTNEKFPIRIEPSPTVFLPSSRSLASQTFGYGQRLIDIDKLWEQYGQGEGVVIFIVDTFDSVDEHPDLLPNNYAELNFNATGRATTDEESDHGLHCAGIAAAVNNDFGILGNAPKSLLGMVKTLFKGSGASSWAVNGLRWIADLDLEEINPDWKGYKKIASCSWGSSRFDQGIANAVDYCFDNDVLVIPAAGNSGKRVDYPGNLPRCLTVGSFGEDLIPSSFTGVGENVDIANAGEAILSTVKSGQYGYKWGTSMSTPGIAGFAACIWGSFPGLTADELRDYITENATDIFDPGFDNKTGFGYAKADNYLENEPAPDPDPGPDPKPDPDPDPDPKPERPRSRDLKLVLTGNFDVIWRRSGDESHSTFEMPMIEVTVFNTKKDVVQIHSEIYGIFEKFFSRSGLVLLDHHDHKEALFYALYFIMMLRFKDVKMTITEAYGADITDGMETQWKITDLKNKFAEQKVDVLSDIQEGVRIEFIPEEVQEIILNGKY